VATTPEDQDVDGDRGTPVSVGDLVLNVRVGGSTAGTPLLLIMGLGGHMGMWQPLESALHPLGVGTVAYDAPGMGHSRPDRRLRRMSGLAAVVVGLLDELGLPQADVLGVSFGGGVAQQLAHDAPDRVRRLVLCATSPGMVSLPGSPRALLALATPRRYADRDYYHRIAPKVFGGASRNTTPRSAASEAIRFGHAPSATGYAQQLFAATGWTSFHWLHTLPQRTLVMAGDDDPIMPLANGRLLSARIPDARMHVVRGGGHLFLAEEADTVAPVITDFLAEPE
jgi:poly(3-hydroxyalkanoate) depolymerase